MTIFYTIYKTTNLINQKYYIGMHKTHDINDKYLGSGALLRRAIKKYGKENFKKDILFVFNTHEDMVNKEIELVTEEVIKDKMSYNRVLGGSGGNIFFKLKNLKYDEVCNKISKSNSGENHPLYGVKRPEHSKFMKTNNLHEKLEKSYLITYSNGDEEVITGFKKFCRSRGYNLGSMNLLLNRKKINRHKDVISIKKLF